VYHLRIVENLNKEETMADNQTMIELLKDKAKENKQLAKKVKKLEEKYVELHKMEKALL
jgi:hypothetical protein